MAGLLGNYEKTIFRMTKSFCAIEILQLATKPNVITRILLFCNAMIPLTYPRAISNTSSSINCFALQILFVPIHK